MNPDAALLRDSVIPLAGGPDDFDPILRLAVGKRVVLIGEASHGTHEFYRIRGEITKRLITGQGFNAVAVEADWPDAYRVNRFVHGEAGDPDAVDALGGFRRFPQWMWRNTDVLDFVGWLRNHNESIANHARKGMPEKSFPTGFYGLDLYSLNASMAAVVSYLDKVDPAAAARVEEKYGCFDQFGGDTQRYGYLAGAGISDDCRKEVIAALVELHGRRESLLGKDGVKAADEFFNADQNARLIQDAEQYYRTMFRSDVSSWNIRDRHMMQTLLLLMQHLRHTHLHAKVVVWAHNSHLGNAAATSMGARGEFNIGQIVKEHFGVEALSIGFTTHTGTVTASTDWDGPAERKYVRESMEGSYERLFHETGIPAFWLDCHASKEITDLLDKPLLERAIGVIYRPETERQSHYFHSSLPAQFDGILHYDETRAVEPLERTALWEKGEVEETYPFGL